MAMPNLTASIANLPEVKVLRLRERLQRGVLLMSPGERKRAILLICSSVVNALLQTAALVSIIPVIMVMFGSLELPLGRAPVWLQQALIGLDKKFVMLILGGGVVALILMKAIYAWVHVGWMAQFSSRCEKRLSSILMRQVLTTHYAWLVQQSTARIRQIAVGFVSSWSRQFVGTLLKLASDFMTAAVIVLLLIWADPRSGVLVLGVLLIFAAGIFLLVRPEHLRLAITKRNASLGANRICLDAVSSVKEIKMAGAEDVVSDIFNGHVARGADAVAKDAQWMTIPQLLLEIIVYGGLVGIGVFIVFFEVQSAEFSGLILLYGLSAMRLAPVVSTFVSGLTRLLNAFPAIDDLCSLLTATATTEQLSVDNMVGTMWRAISLQRVSLKYEKAERAAVREISLAVRRGLSYGVVGPSGAGKSTVVDLIVGLLEPTDGLVLVDGVPLIADNRRTWRRRFGYVAQRPFFLDASLRENITFNFSDNVDEERLKRVIKLASLDQVVAKLPDGCFSRLGEQGALLSGGERQRVAIARALYRGANILILDEATSSLDPLVEKEIAESIVALHGEVTTIIVSHRLGLVRYCDEIWVFEDGRLLASGAHEELLSASGLYLQMVTQSARDAYGGRHGSSDFDHSIIAPSG